MAERNRNGNVNTEVSVENRITEIMRIIKTLDYVELKRVHELIGEEYKVKSEETRTRVIAEVRANFEELGLTFEEVVELSRKRKRVRAPAEPKYRSPDGMKTWTGRGVVPKWIKEHEESGGNREDFLIK
jgi:DNA-binding protein H-NS